MKIEDMDEVNFLVNVIRKIDKNIITIKEYLNSDESKRKDSGSKTSGIDSGYFCHVSPHGDGSGHYSLDLAGCYVQNQVYRATYDVLLDQRKFALDRLKELDVDAEGMNP